jgi:hypothetical protein
MIVRLAGQPIWMKKLNMLTGVLVQSLILRIKKDIDMFEKNLIQTKCKK